MPPRKVPPATRTRCAAPGEQEGCSSVSPGFVAQAKKGGSGRHGAKAFDLCVAVVRQEEEQEQLAALAPLIRPAGTFSRKREKGFLIRRCVPLAPRPGPAQRAGRSGVREPMARKQHAFTPQAGEGLKSPLRSEEHTSELQSLMRNS